ncbi:RecBCD enzyme subunit RecC [biofilm metagenome]
MFILHSSNLTENLLEHLVSVIKHAPLQSPFSKEVFLIQSQGMERWLSQQLATRFDVWANYEFLFPGRFFSTIAQQLDSRIDGEAFDRSVILWRLEALLRNLDNADFEPLTHYLTGANQALKRYQLAQQLSQIFDQYQIMRPELLAAWQQGRLLYNTDVERWQQVLWRQLTEQIGQKHRGALWLDVIEKLNTVTDDAITKRLPERISVFGVNTMPPLFLTYLQSVSKHCDVHLFLLNPAQGFWADLATERHQSSGDGDTNGHPLLASLGQQGREFQEMLLEFSEFDVEPSSFEAINNPNNLQQLQNDILNNTLPGIPLINDGSISFHACHSRKREVEILRDQLLLVLENDHDVELRDIAVMAPDIQLYEPFISAAFSDIQHAIADRSLRLENQALDSFIRFLELSQSRLGWQSVLDLLERPDVFPNFGLSEVDLELIKHWVQDTNVRWGQSGQHKLELGLPEFNEHTWQAALDRLLMGYAVNNDDVFIDDVLPYSHIEGSSAEALGGLHDFLHVLFQAKAELKQAKSLKTWGLRLFYFAGQLLGNSELSTELVERQQLNEILLELTDTLADVHTEPVELQVITQWLEGMIAERKSANGFLRGQLTFCSMLPMRSIPFKVIGLLGINEGEFPKIDRKPTFDLIAQHFRKGDRSRRADDRYQFLEILLSARQRLIITYIGQSQANNEAIPPSVVVTELLDVLRDYHQLTGLVTQHPLQPFSQRYFDGSDELFSFSANDCETAKALTAPKPDVTVWWHGRIEEKVETGKADEMIIELSDLFWFFQHPQRYFFRKQLNLKLSQIATETEEREPFSAGESGLYAIHQSWLQHLLNDNQIALKKLQAQGAWPSGGVGVLEFEQHQLALQAFAERIKKLGIGKPMDELSVDLHVNDYRVLGSLENLYENGSLLYRYANLKGKDFMAALLHHLLINQLDGQVTTLISADETLIFRNEICQPEWLPGLIEIYQQGQQRPDVFFTEAALVYLAQATKPKARKSPLDAANEFLYKTKSYESEQELRQLYGNDVEANPLLGEAFAETCERLLLPAWQAAHED